MCHGLEDELSQMIAVEVQVDVPDSADARWCIEQYFLELAERFDTGFDPIKSNPAPDEDLVPPRGYFVVARLDGHPVGCGVLKRKNPTTGEIKRMWTALLFGAVLSCHANHHQPVHRYRGRGLSRSGHSSLEPVES
jgi:hypothetical protein